MAGQAGAALLNQIGNWIDWLNTREAVPATRTNLRVAATILTEGTWNKATKTVTLPAGWTSSGVGVGNILVRLGMQRVDLPKNWRVDTGLPTPTPTPPPTPTPAPTPTPVPLPDGMADLISRHNTFRASQGLAPLLAESHLMRAASDYADDLVRRGMLSHFGANGSTPWDRMEAAGYAWSQASENIAMGQTSNAEVVEDWEQSPGHRADMLGPYKHIGCGRSGNFWVVDFASPK